MITGRFDINHVPKVRQKLMISHDRDLFRNWLDELLSSIILNPGKHPITNRNEI